MTLAAMVATLVQYIGTGQVLLDLLHGHPVIMLMVHSIQHQYMSTDDKQQCVDQCFHGMPANQGRRNLAIPMDRRQG